MLENVKVAQIKKFKKQSPFIFEFCFWEDLPHPRKCIWRLKCTTSALLLHYFCTTEEVMRKVVEVMRKIAEVMRRITEVKGERWKVKSQNWKGDKWKGEKWKVVMIHHDCDDDPMHHDFDDDQMHHDFFKVYFSKVYLSKVYFCEMSLTCASSKLCKFIISKKGFPKGGLPFGKNSQKIPFLEPPLKQRPKNPGSAVALLTWNFYASWKFLRVCYKRNNSVRTISKLSGQFQNCPDGFKTVRTV